MSATDIFNKSFEPAHGDIVALEGNISRVTCNNTGPFTFMGTNSYLVGKDALAVIDPGPLDETHLAALLKGIGARPVSHIFATHTHIDHSPLVARLAEKTGAKVVGAAPHHAARDLHLGEINALDASADRDYAPDIVLEDGDTIEGDGWTISAIATPGHTANHLSFALNDTGVVFSGDHIMAWATTIVAPPDGAMGDYMASLDKMLARQDRLYLPGHGGPVDNTAAFVRGLKAHRKMRERAIIERLRQGDETIGQMVQEIYRDTDPRLHGAASLSVFAHLEHLIEQDRVACATPPSLQGRYTIAT